MQLAAISAGGLGSAGKLARNVSRRWTRISKPVSPVSLNLQDRRLHLFAG
jgi:hypothetical protein